jgi:hypothetical protein
MATELKKKRLTADEAYAEIQRRLDSYPMTLSADERSDLGKAITGAGPHYILATLDGHVAHVMDLNRVEEDEQDDDVEFVSEVRTFKFTRTPDETRSNGWLTKMICERKREAKEAKMRGDQLSAEGNPAALRNWEIALDYAGDATRLLKILEARRMAVIS